jgi:hypothetical protein
MDAHVTGVVDPLNLHPGGQLEEWRDGVQSEGTLVRRWPTFTCEHCGITVFINPGRQRPRKRCLRCMGARDPFGDLRLGWCCDRPGCDPSNGCRSVYLDDSPLAHADTGQQPWLLRDAEGYPVDRIWTSATECILVRRNDNGMTQREMARQARPFILPEWLARFRELEDKQKETLIHERDASGSWTRTADR